MATEITVRRKIVWRGYCYLDLGIQASLCSFLSVSFATTTQPLALWSEEWQRWNLLEVEL